MARTPPAAVAELEDGEAVDLADPTGIPEGVNLTPMPDTPREQWGDAEWRLARLRRLEIAIAQRMGSHFAMVDGVLQIEEGKLWTDRGFPSMAAYFEVTFGRTWKTGKNWLAVARETRALTAPNAGNDQVRGGETVSPPSVREARKAQAARKAGEAPPAPTPPPKTAAAARKRVTPPPAAANGQAPGSKARRSSPPAAAAPPPGPSSVDERRAMVAAMTDRHHDDLFRISAQEAGRFDADRASGVERTKAIRDWWMTRYAEAVSASTAKLGGGTGGRS